MKLISITRRPLAICGVALVLVLLLLVIPIYTDCALVCENTGSQMGYRSSFGLRTKRWYKKSALETFMAAKYPKALQHRWVSYSGTGHHLIGGVSHAHGSPGPILLLTGGVLASHVAKLSDLDKKRLYDTFASGDAVAIQSKAKEIEDAWLNRRKQSRVSH